MQVPVLKREKKISTDCSYDRKTFLGDNVDSNPQSSVLWDIYNSVKVGKLITDKEMCSECVSVTTLDILLFIGHSLAQTCNQISLC
jgi:hypothetical protein